MSHPEDVLHDSSGQDSHAQDSQNHTPVSTPVSRSSSATSHPGPNDLSPGLHELWEVVFCRQAERDDLDAPKHITILTWFLDHLRHRTCQVDRSVALDRHWQDWMDTLTDLWRDRYDPGTPLMVTLVRPEPPRGTGEFHTAQVILTQGASHDISSLVTAVFEMDDGPKRAWRSAVVLPPGVTQYDVLSHIPGNHQSSAHEFWVVHDETVLGNMPHPIPHGASLVAIKGLPRAQQVLDPVVHQRTHRLEAHVGPQDDEAVLVQLPATVVMSHGKHDGSVSLDRSSAPDDLPGTADPHEPDQFQPTEDIPDYLQNVQADAARHFQHHDDAYCIRTWYIHHHRVWTWQNPRTFCFAAQDIVQWRTCHYAILDAWADRIDHTEDMVFAEVFPQLRHCPSDGSVHVDLILSQGITAPRNAVIMTLVGERTGRLLRRVASSAPILVGGLRLLNLASFDDICDATTCRMWHVHTQLTITNVPDFRSRDGQSIVVQVQENDDVANSSPSHECTSVRNNDDSPLGPDPASDVNDVRVLRMYRLSKPMESAAVAWHSYEQLMFNVSRALSIPITDVQQVHEMNVDPVGQSDFETVVILQTVDDVAPGSDERMILLDCELHVPHETGSPPVAPRIERFALKVVKQLVRAHVLQLAGIDTELGRSFHECLVYHNNVLWNAQDISLHTLHFGDYVRIVVPPPAVPDRVNLDSDTDGGSLIQLHASVYTQQSKTLCLEKCIAAPQWTYVECDRVQFLHAQLSHCILPEPRFNFNSIEWHPAAEDAIRTVPCWTHEVPLAFWFFTDGSTHRNADSVVTAAAAAVLIVETSDGDRIGGYHEFEVDGRQSAQRAENTAILGATFWALQLTHQWKHRCRPQIHFCFDSTTAGYANEGSWRSNSHQDLTTIVRSLVHWIEEIHLDTCHWSHVYSHRGNAWNEMADCVAWHYAKTPDRRVKLAALRDLCTFDGNHPRLHHWLWYYERACRGHAQAPLIDGGFFKYNVTAPFAVEPDAQSHPVIRRQTVDDESIRCTSHCDLKVATANVLSLFAKEDDTGAFRSTRVCKKLAASNPVTPSLMVFTC